MSSVSFATLYLKELTQEVIPFWEKYSIDRENGGYFTCIDDQHKVFDTDKFVWLQARQVWTFATLYDRLEKKQTWFEIARSGSDFLENTDITAITIGFFPLIGKVSPWWFLIIFFHTLLLVWQWEKCITSPEKTSTKQRWVKL